MICAPASECVTKVKNLRMRKEDFETLRVIGKGAFGQVSSFRMTNAGVYVVGCCKWQVCKCYLHTRVCTQPVGSATVYNALHRY